jgi:DNA-binding NarL/FixJ family response regulator
MDKIKILIADDHAVVREDTRQILGRESDLIETCASAKNAQKLVQ